MFWVQAIVAVAIVCGTVLAASGRGDGVELPRRAAVVPWLDGDRPVRAEDVTDLRLGVGVRGYRMDEVDDVLDRLTGELADRDATIERLRRQEDIRRIATAVGAAPAGVVGGDPSVVGEPGVVGERSGDEVRAVDAQRGVVAVAEAGPASTRADDVAAWADPRRHIAAAQPDDPARAEAADSTDTADTADTAGTAEENRG